MTHQTAPSQADSRAMLLVAEGDLRAAMAALQRALACLEDAIEATVQEGLEGLPSPTAPASEHRRKHRPGRPAKIDSDPELQAFIAARVDRMTFPSLMMRSRIGVDSRPKSSATLSNTRSSVERCVMPSF